MKKIFLWSLVLLMSISMIAMFSLAGCKEEVVEEEVAEEEVVEEEEEAPAEETTTAATPTAQVSTAAITASTITTNTDGKVRTIITTDGEIDDNMSLIRYLLYANEFELAGLVASASMFHYTSKEGETFKDKTFNQRVIDAYAEVYENLSAHADGYPTPEYLTSINVNGNISAPGEIQEDTEGSDLIKSCILDDREDTLFLQVWGGTNTVASALRSIENEYKDTDQWEDIYKKVCSKVVIYFDLDQDDTLNSYILPNWPDIKVLGSYKQFNAVAYWWKANVPKKYQETLTKDWFNENIYGKGALADFYEERTTGEEAAATTAAFSEMGMATGWNSAEFLSEGDSPNYWYILDVGLRQLEGASYGGWGGRFSLVKDGFTSMLSSLYTNTADDGDISKPLYRWIEALQNDFAARMSWCTESYEDANHEPVITVEEGLDFTGIPGSTVTLTASATDPDGNNVDITFWQYEDADTYAGSVDITDLNNGQITFTIPEDAKVGDTIHIIVEGKDDGTNPITRYQRVIVTVAAVDAEETAQ